MVSRGRTLKLRTHALVRRSRGQSSWCGGLSLVSSHISCMGWVGEWDQKWTDSGIHRRLHNPENCAVYKFTFIHSFIHLCCWHSILAGLQDRWCKFSYWSRWDKFLDGTEWFEAEPGQDEHYVYIHDERISISDKVTSLGIIADKHMTFDDQTDHGCKSSINHLRNLFRIRRFLSRALPQRLYMHL